MDWLGLRTCLRLNSDSGGFDWVSFKYHNSSFQYIESGHVVYLVFSVFVPHLITLKAAFWLVNQLIVVGIQLVRTEVPETEK
jgi:hypothetical protein